MDLPDEHDAGGSGSDHGSDQFSPTKRKRQGSLQEEAVGDRDGRSDTKVQILSDDGHAAKRQRMQKKLKKYKDAYDRRGMR